MRESLEEVRAALAGRYDVEREIGAGGMASVFLASDLRHERRVAIKVLHAPNVDRGIDRFQQEIRLAAGLTHPHILPVLDSGGFESGGPRIWYATPWVQGESLRDRLAKEGPLPVAEAVRIVAQIADALDYAHRQGVVHRDVKPDNILLADGQVFLADFGVAVSASTGSGRRLTESGMTVGTPVYMSPEQATGSDGVDYRTDIYSLGCVLFETLAGSPPFDGASAMAIVARVLTEAPPSIALHRPAARAMDPIVEQALSRLPADRFQSAAEMGQALRSAASAQTGVPPRAPSRSLSRPAALLGSALAVSTVAFGAFQWFGPPTLDSEVREARIAVLPFRAIGDDAREAVRGITLATRDQLSVIEGIAVVGAVSSEVERLGDMPAADVLRELGSDYVLTATVERNSSTGSIEVRPTLIGGSATRIDLWSDAPLVAPVDQPGRVELTIASDVARVLDLTVGAAARAGLTGPGLSPIAYGIYVRALGQGGAQRSARLREALAVDSTFALARAPLAHTAMVRFQTTHAAEDSAALLGHAQAMIRHAPQFAGGYLYLGLYHRTVSLDYDSAIAYMDQARALAPGDSEIGLHRASALWAAGRLDEALIEARRGAGLDPLSSSARSRVSRILLWQHEFQEARRLHEETLKLGVANIAAFVLADGPLLFAAMGMLDSAQAHVSTPPVDARRYQIAAFLNDISAQGWLVPSDLRAAVCNDLDGAIGSGFIYVPFQRQVGCAIGAWRDGDRTRARLLSESILDSLAPVEDAGSTNRRVHMGLAFARFFLGDREGAVESAETALALLPPFWDYYPGAFNAVQYVQLAGMMGDVEMAIDQLGPMLDGYSPLTRAWVGVDPAFDPIRDDPRFRALVTIR